MMGSPGGVVSIVTLPCPGPESETTGVVAGGGVTTSGTLGAGISSASTIRLETARPALTETDTLVGLYPSFETVIKWLPTDNSKAWGVTNPVPPPSTVISAPLMFEVTVTVPFLTAGVTDGGVSWDGPGGVTTAGGLVGCWFAGCAGIAPGGVVLAPGWVVSGVVELLSGVVVGVLGFCATGPPPFGVPGSVPGWVAGCVTAGVLFCLACGCGK